MTSAGPPPLVCPVCRGGLRAAAGGVDCAGCGQHYPLIEGVLRLVAGRIGAPGFDPSYFSALAQVEDRHYWFVTRRELIVDALQRSVPDLPRRALFDIGCGTGGLLAHLAARGVPLAGACDAYVESLALARGRVVAPLVLVDEGRLPPLGRGHTLISLFDVLEHIDDDLGALRFLFDVLEPGGVLVLTVPAHPFLFDEMDALAHHRRRYRRQQLGERLAAAGFEVRLLTHFMAPLMPLAIVRWLTRLLLPGRTSLQRRALELAVVPGANGALLALLGLERRLLRLGPLPFGSSLIAVAARPAGAPERGVAGSV